MISTNRGRTFTDFSASIYSTYSVRPYGMTRLGGKTLEASYFSQVCWYHWIYCPWVGYPKIWCDPVYSYPCTELDPYWRYGEECSTTDVGAGVMYSDDSGATWRLQPGAHIGFYIGGGVMVDGLGGISTDNGVTWTWSNAVVDNQPMPADMYFITAAWNHKTGIDRVLLGLASGNSADIALLKSNDGSTWTTLDSFTFDSWSGPPIYRGQPEAIAIGPNGSALMTVHSYDPYTCYGCEHYDVYASRDAGDTWQLAAVPAGLPATSNSLGLMYVGSGGPAP